MNASSDRVDSAHNFVAGDYRYYWLRQLAIDDVEVRAADAAGCHLHTNLAISWLPVS
jgi:hypothetical protein